MINLLGVESTFRTPAGTVGVEQGEESVAASNETRESRSLWTRSVFVVCPYQRETPLNKPFNSRPLYNLITKMISADYCPANGDK